MSCLGVYRRVPPERSAFQSGTATGRGAFQSRARIGGGDGDAADAPDLEPQPHPGQVELHPGLVAGPPCRETRLPPAAGSAPVTLTLLPVHTATMTRRACRAGQGSRRPVCGGWGPAAGPPLPDRRCCRSVAPPPVPPVPRCRALPGPPRAAAAGRRPGRRDRPGCRPPRPGPRHRRTPGRRSTAARPGRWRAVPRRRTRAAAGRLGRGLGAAGGPVEHERHQQRRDRDHHGEHRRGPAALAGVVADHVGGAVAGRDVPDRTRPVASSPFGRRSVRHGQAPVDARQETYARGAASAEPRVRWLGRTPGGGVVDATVSAGVPDPALRHSDVATRPPPSARTAAASSAEGRAAGALTSSACTGHGPAAAPRAAPAADPGRRYVRAQHLGGGLAVPGQPAGEAR